MAAINLALFQRVKDRLRTRSAPERVALAQGAFMVATGLWPIVHLRSFTWVTGPKLEGWLVKTMGLFISVVGGTLLESVRTRRVTPEIAKLAIGSAVAFALVDTVYVAKRRISPVYLGDAVTELALVGWWRSALVNGRPMVEDGVSPSGNETRRGDVAPSLVERA